jgi:leucyl-tRNA synthetase
VASRPAGSGLPFIDDGVLVNSAAFNGMTSEEGRRAITQKLSAAGAADFRVNYKLRDWLVSRQRYWGTPIPVIHCKKCGAVPVPEDELPVLLPYNVAFTPDGESPLIKSEEFMNARCPACGAEARRDPDTLDTFVCSSWYFLRYLDNKNEDKPFDTEWIDRMSPVDVYVGGPEHAVMHLLYARFAVKALRDMGFLHFDEPFTRLVHQGMILGRDGAKMSKRLGNTVSPDEYIEKYGSDVFRTYLGFGFAYTDGGPWNDEGIKAAARFVSRAERMSERIITFCRESGADAGRIFKSIKIIDTAGYGSSEKELDYTRNNSIKSASADMERFQFNTTISRSMELLNALYKYDADVSDEKKDAGLFVGSFIDLLRLVSPFAPHFCEEIWETLGLPYSIFNSGNWPQYSEAALERETVELAVQINGVVRYRINVPQDADDADIEAAATRDGRFAPFLESAGGGGKPAEIAKIMVIRKRLVSIVVK